MMLIKTLHFFAISLFLSSAAFAQIPGTWERHQLPSDNIGQYFFPDSVSIVALASKFFSTTNGGLTWDSAQPQAPYTVNTFHVFSAPKTSAIFAFQKARPQLINSTNGGKDWNVMQDTIQLFTPAPLFTMWSEIRGALFVRSDTNVYKMLVTYDGCRTFEEIMPDSVLHFAFDHAPNSPSWCWADSMNGILWNITLPNKRHLAVTHDGGKHWSVADVRSPTGDTDVTLKSRPGSASFAAGVYTLAPNQELPYYYYSTDLGNHWQTTDTTAPTELEAVSAASPYSLWSSGWKDRFPHEIEKIGVLLYTNNYGKYWLRDTTTFWDYGINLVHFVDSTHGYVVGGFQPRYLFRYIPAANAAVKTFSQHGIALAPNPCSTDLKLFSDQKILQISIYDMLGNRVLNQKYPDETISLQGLIPNQYFIEVMTAHGREWRSILKVSP